MNLLRNCRAAVAIEASITIAFVFLAALVPTADLGLAYYQYSGASGALRSFGAFVQNRPPTDVTDISSWLASLPTSVNGFPISNVQVICGSTVCSIGNQTSPIKSYSYSTQFTLSPIILNWLRGTYTIVGSERFQ